MPDNWMSRSFSTEAKYALNAICPYYAMFPLEFPMRILGRLSKDSVVLDPFCGRGTTNYAAQVLGMKSYGVDSSPVAVAIAQAKFAHAPLADVITLAQEIIETTIPEHVPEGRFWRWAFHRSTLNDVCALREGLMKRRLTDEVAILRALSLGCLHGPRNKSRQTLAYFSNQMPRTFASKPDSAVRFWISRHLRPIKVDVVSVLARKAERALSNLSIAPNSPRDIKRGDSSTCRGLSHINDPIDIVVTSPPYYGLQTYVEDQWLRNWFLGGSETVPYGHPTGLRQSSPGDFTYAMSKVWYQIENVASDDARLVIRFGAIPSKAVDPKEIIRESLSLAGSRWTVYRTLPIGTAASGKRQAAAMGTKTRPLVEYDFFCRAA
jgi:predicted RNA methylase